VTKSSICTTLATCNIRQMWVRRASATAEVTF